MKKRMKVSLSNTKLFTGNMGKLLPIAIYEALPDDTFNIRTNVLVRMAPLATPVMHPVRCRLFHYKVPFRLLWDSAEDFFTQGIDGNFSGTIPKVTLTEANRAVGGMPELMGLPPGPTSYKFAAWPIQAVNLIYNTDFRDPNLQPARLNPTGNGDFDSTTLDITLPSVNWNKDRFTTARVDPQTGADPLIPLSGEAIATGTSSLDVTLKSTLGINQITRRADNHNVYNSSAIASDASGLLEDSSGGVKEVIDPNGTLEVDLDGEEFPLEFDDLGTFVEDIRHGVALKRFRERIQRGGGRYRDYLKNFFGVNYSDKTLQNPQLIGTQQGMINFSEVLQTAPNSDEGTTDDNGVGNMKGHGIAYVKTKGFRHYVEEHSCIVTLMSIEPVAMYTQGIEKMWLKTFREDFYTKDFAQLGEEEVFNYEVYGNQTAPSDPFGRFGWQRKYYDYLSKLNSIGGEFRTTLNDWHMGRIFDANVALNSAFVTCDPTNRIFQATTAAQFYCRADHSVQVRRPMIPSRPGIL